MSKPIRSFPKSVQADVIDRRIAGNTGGLGYLSAVEALEHIKRQAEQEAVKKGRNRGK